MEEMPAVGAIKLGLRVGFNAGPVIQRDNDVFGDTVNLASRLVDQAGKGQIITSAETAARLGPMFRSWLRQLYAIQVKGKAEEVALTEIVWKVDQNITKIASAASQPRSGLSVLRLKYLGKETVLRRETESVTLGRDPDCGLPIPNEHASRQHCTIERRSDRWVLKDHSANGTWITAEGEDEILLQREEYTLGRHGWIAFGHPRAEAAGRRILLRVKEGREKQTRAPFLPAFQFRDQAPPPSPRSRRGGRRFGSAGPPSAARRPGPCGSWYAMPVPGIRRPTMTFSSAAQAVALSDAAASGQYAVVS
jgi:hypothetical protein